MTRHIADPAPAIDVDQIRLKFLCHASGAFHGSSFSAVDLNAEWPFFRKEHHLSMSFLRLPDEPFRIHKFGVHDISAQLLANEAEWNVRHILHRCKEQSLWNLNIIDVHT